MSKCKKLAKNEQTTMVDVNFLNNLHPIVKKKMLDGSYHERESITNVISSVEELILTSVKEENAQPLKGATTNYKHKNDFNKESNKYTQYKVRNQNHGQRQKAKYWCDYHQTSTHDSSNCRATQSNKAIHTRQVNNMIQQSNVINLKAKLGDVNIIALVDTGASLSYVNEELIKKHGIKTKPIKEMVVKIANGREVTLNKKIQVDVIIEQVPDMIFEIDLICMPEMNNDAILGMDWLLQHKVILDLNEKTLRFKEQEIEILGKEHLVNELNTIMEPTAIEKIQIMVDEYKIENPELGLIKGYEYEIHTTNTEPINVRKTYTVPLNLRQETKDLLSNLQKNDVISKSDSPYCCPAFIIPKKPSGIRLIVDSRPLNSVTKPELFPFPTLQEQATDLHGSQVFS